MGKTKQTSKPNVDPETGKYIDTKQEGSPVETTLSGRDPRAKVAKPS